MTARRLAALLALFFLPFSIGSCKKQPEAKVQNAVTDYVDRGVATMEKAEVVVDATNEWTKQMEEQTKAAASQ